MSIMSSIGLGLRSRAMTPLALLNKSLLQSRIAQFRGFSRLAAPLAFVPLRSNTFNRTMFMNIAKKYSTGTAPPPPPPPHHDKNAKGKRILDRISRAFTFSLSSAIVFAAAGVALLVVYLILSELFLPSGDTRTFNKAVKLVEKNEEAHKVLRFEKGTRLKAYGEVGPDAWVRNRPAHGVRGKGKDGKDHLFMRFHVVSDSGIHGTVSLEQVDKSFWSSEFSYIALDVPGQKRVFIIEPKHQSKNYIPKLNGNEGFLGLKWGPKKDN